MMMTKMRKLSKYATIPQYMHSQDLYLQKINMQHSKQAKFSDMQQVISISMINQLVLSLINNPLVEPEPVVQMIKQVHG